MSDTKHTDDPLKCCPRFSWGDGSHDLNCPSVRAVPRYVKADPAPIYDEVFDAGVAALDADAGEDQGFWGRTAARLSIENKKLREQLRRACDIGLRLSKSNDVDAELKTLYPSEDEP